MMYLVLSDGSHRRLRPIPSRMGRNLVCGPAAGWDDSGSMGLDMDAREYMSIRKAYNLVRQGVSKDERLSFSEFSILCRLVNSDEGIKTSDIADYQHVLRPTMTHRTKHLAQMGLIQREQGRQDKRNILCQITPEGVRAVDDLCERTRASIRPQEPLSRTTADRIRAYVDSMGAVACNASGLVLVGTLVLDGEAHTVSQLVNLLGLLQPTVSMSIASLEESGLLRRVGDSRHGFQVALTDEGRDAAEAMRDRIESLVVRRRRHSKA